MSSAQKLTSRNSAIVGCSLCVAGISGIAVGWLVAPSGASALGYVQSVAAPTCFGAMCVYAVRRGGRPARWLPLLFAGVFLLDISTSPHVPVLSALGLAAAAFAAVTAQRGHERTTIVGMIVSCLLLAATLIAGRLLS